MPTAVRSLARPLRLSRSEKDRCRPATSSKGTFFIDREHETMNTKQLGNSDLFITPIGFGAWAIGGSGWEFAWGAQDDTASIAAIHRALALGVNWIDTAAVYGTGHSEEVVARALASWPGPRPYVFTKCGLRWDGQRKVHYVLKADSIRRECEDSLRRLQVETIDLYQIHWPVDDTAELEEGWTAMAQLQQEGKD